MNKLMNDLPLSIFEGNTQIVDSSVFPITTIRGGDTQCERVVIQRNGTQVQILRHDGDNRSVMVTVGWGTQTMPLARVAEYVKQSTNGGAQKK